MRINEQLRKAVAFIGYLEGERFVAAGTAFFVGYPIGVQDRISTYLVTADHVIRGLVQRDSSEAIIRLNTATGSTLLRAHLERFLTHPTSNVADVAVLPVGSISQYDQKALPIDLFATPDHVENDRIGVGDQVYFIGCFVNHAGRQRNVPIVRVGNIAAIPEEPISTAIGDMEGYIIEGVSVGGFSGSPIFVAPTRQVVGGPSIDFGEGMILLGHLKLALLGLVHGHFVAVEVSSTTANSDATTGLRARDEMNAGFAIVVPAQLIKETLEQEELVQRRALLAAAFSESQDPFAGVPGPPPGNSTNT